MVLGVNHLDLISCFLTPSSKTPAIKASVTNLAQLQASFINAAYLIKPLDCMASICALAKS